MQVMEGAHGKVDSVVLRVLAAAEELFSLVEYADDGIEASLDVDLLADGVFTIHKQLLRSVVSQQTHVRMTLVLFIGKDAARQQDQIGYIRNLRGVALQDGAGHFATLVLYAYVADAEGFG